MTSRDQPNSNGVRRWLHPDTKDSRKDERKASLTSSLSIQCELRWNEGDFSKLSERTALQARHVKEVPIDASLLKGGPKNFGTHRVRRKGLPTHVPPSWLVPNPSDGSLDQHTLGKQGQEDLMIQAGRHSGSPQRAVQLSPSKSHSSSAQGSQHYDSTYSYVFRHGSSHRPRPTAEHRRPPAPGEIGTAHGESLHEAEHTEAESSSRGRSQQSRAELSAKKSAVNSSQGAAQQQSSSGPDSFAFPELSSAVRSFASIPLKPLPQLPAAACSPPGPLEESLLRHRDNAVETDQGLTPDPAGEPATSSPPTHSPHDIPQDGSSGRPEMDLGPRYGREQDSPCLEQPGPAAVDAHSVKKAGSTVSFCDPAPAERLGPNFQRLVASFQERKSQQTSDHSGSTYSNPVFEATTLSDSLQALKARSAGAADSSGRRLSEDTMTSTAATKHPRSYNISCTPGYPKREITASGCGLTGGATAAGAEQAQQAGSVSGTHGKAASPLSKAVVPVASARSGKHAGQGSEAPQPAGVATGAPAKQAARAHDGRASALATCAAEAARVRRRAVPARLGDASAACPVTPADISAEITERVISRQLLTILGMLCAAAALSLTCSLLLIWRLFRIADRSFKSGDRQLAGIYEGTNYASLTPAWWPI